MPENSPSRNIGVVQAGFRDRDGGGVEYIMAMTIRNEKQKRKREKKKKYPSLGTLGKQTLVDGSPAIPPATRGLWGTGGGGGGAGLEKSAPVHGWVWSGPAGLVMYVCVNVADVRPPPFPSTG